MHRDIPPSEGVSIFFIEKEPDNYLNLRGNENRNLQSKISIINDEELQELNNAFDKKHV